MLPLLGGGKENQLMRDLKFVFLVLNLLGGLAVFTGCGVKADPQPPATPVEIGHGKPMFKSEDDAPALPRKVSPEEEQKNEQESDEID